MSKYKYNINNLDCANCARTIEDTLNKNTSLQNVVVNFNTSTISYETDNLTIKEINKLVSNIEDGVTVTEIINQNKEYKLLPLILGIIFAIVGLYIKMPWYFNDIFIILSYILLLYKTFIKDVHMILKGKLNENLLISVSCIGAYLVGQKMEGAMVITLYVIGKILEEKAVNNTRTSIKDLMNIKQDYANLLTNNNITQKNVLDINIGDLLLVKKGEKIPVDGIVVAGSTTLDTSSLTGESLPLPVKEKSQVLSGAINNSNNITIKVTKKYVDSTVAKILDLVESATDKKTKVETLVSKISKIYTPLVLVLALITAFVLPLFGLSYELSIYRALTFLVISCPCAIAISVPLSYFTGIGISSKNGILIKGSNYLDNLSNLKKIVFDKTGTLTDGLTISEIKVLDKKYSNEEVLDILLKGESLSNHPIAKSILKLKSQKIDTSKVKKFKEVEGLGISFKLGNQKIKIGNAKMCKCKNNSNLHLNINDKHIASIFLTDSIKKDAKKALEELDKLGIKTYLFTGDKKDKALEIATQLKFYDVKYEMLPEDKYNAFIELKNNEMSSFVGDGVNDAPVLKVSDIGISMGSIGQASAVEASDIVILDDDLKKIPLAIKVSNYTKLIIKENLIFALGTKIIILILSFFGLTNMLFAVFADTGVTLLAILNTLRILWKKY